jgi:2'-5' RNA ligase
VRCFVALHLPEDVRIRLQAVQRELAAAGADVRSVGPETFHLTLRFLGELDAAALDRVVDALGPALAARPALRIEVEHFRLLREFFDDPRGFVDRGSAD